jgi:glycosyltransferase involved in cell wall biosynthesis
VWWIAALRSKKRGSFEDQLLAVAARLRAEGTNFHVVLAEAPASFRDALTREGARVHTLDFLKAMAPWTLAGWLREWPAELVHFHFVRPYSPLVAAARFSGAKVVVNDHVTLEPASRSKARQAMKKLRGMALNPLFHRRVAVSTVVADSVVEIEEVDPEMVDVIENGIDLDRFIGGDGAPVRRELGLGERPLILCVSRLQKEKGVETAIRMMPGLGRDAVLALAGDGPMEAEWRRLVVTLHLEDRVRFLGVRHDVERLYAAADVVVAPSHWEEAFGLAVVEAMASSRAVVVTRSGAMPELVGDAGVVVPKKDWLALAGAVSRLLDDRTLAARLGEAARQRAEARYSMPRFVDDVIALYRQLGVGRRLAAAAA